MQITVDTNYDSTKQLRAAARAILEQADILDDQERIDLDAFNGVKPAVEVAMPVPAAKSVIVEVEIPVNIAKADLPETGADDPAFPDPVSFFGNNSTGYKIGDPHPAVAVAPAPAPTPAVAAVPTIVPIVPEKDVHGMPWDARIHSASRAKTQDGSWRMKRGLDKTPGLQAQVEAEIKLMMGLPAPAAAQAAPAPASTTAALPAAAPAPASPPAPPLPPTAPSAPVSVSGPTVSPVASPAPTSVTPVPPASIATTASPTSPPPPPPPVPGAAPITFGALLQRLTAGYTAGTFTQSQVLAEMAAMGVPQFPLLMQRPDLIPVLAEKLGLPTTMAA